MLNENQIILARNWMYSRPDSHHHDGYQRLRRHMILAGVDLPFRLTKEHTETEQHLLCVYFDVLQEWADAAHREELRRMYEGVRPQTTVQDELDELEALLASKPAGRRRSRRLAAA
jgi:hypothetical protein